MLLDTTYVPNQFKQLSDGILLFYDNNRSKYLSTSRENITFGIDGKNINIDRWLRAVDGIPTNNTGFKIPRNGTIVAGTIQCKNSANCIFHIRKNNNVSDIATLTLNGNSGIIDNNLNIDVNVNDWIQLYMTVQSDKVDYPLFSLELAWRE